LDDQAKAKHPNSNFLVTRTPLYKTASILRKTSTNKGITRGDSRTSPEAILNFFPKRYCQSEGHGLNCSRSYEQRDLKKVAEFISKAG
jgi:hypothetical protein